MSGSVVEGRGSTTMEAKVTDLATEVYRLEEEVRLFGVRLQSIYGSGGIPDVTGIEAQPKEAAPVPAIITLETCTRKVLETGKWISEAASMV